MELIQWDESFSVNNEAIDHQHQKLVAMVNTMINYRSTSVTSEVISEMLTEMTEYSCTHFKSEEAYMKQIAYPDLEAHIEEHRQFRLNVGKLCLKTMNYNTSIPREILQFLSEWLVDHILEEDIKYKTFCVQEAAASGNR